MPRTTVKPTPQELAARRNYEAVPHKTVKDDPERYTKTPHEYGDLLIFGGKLGGPLQRDLVYWIERRTWGDTKRPEWAKLSLTALAKLCQVWDPDKEQLRPVERKSVAIALADLERRGIIESRDRKGCGPTVAKMYKLTPERWKAAEPYRPPTPKEVAEADAQTAEEDDDTPEDGTEAPAPAPEQTVANGKLSRPQPVSVRPSRNAEPVVIRLIYNPSGFDCPVSFRARTGANGRIQVSASPAKSGEEKEKNCSRAQPQFPKSSVANKRFSEFVDVIQTLALEKWGFALDAALVKRIITGAGNAPPILFDTIARAKLATRGRHVPGLLVNLASSAADSHAAESQLEARQRAGRSTAANSPLNADSPTEAELERMQADHAEAHAQAIKRDEERRNTCDGCNGTGKRESGITGVFRKCGGCGGTGKKRGSR